MALVRARETFWMAGTKKQPFPQLIPEGEILDEKDPIVRKRPHLFGPVDAGSGAPPSFPAVEQATAAPGEARNTTIPKE